MHGLGAHVAETRRMPGIALDLRHLPVTNLYEQATPHTAVRTPGRPVVAVVGRGRLMRWHAPAPRGGRVARRPARTRSHLRLGGAPRARGEGSVAHGKPPRGGGARR